MILIALVTVLINASGCLFEPRAPEPPRTSAIQYIDAINATAVWENCRLSLSNKDSGGWESSVSENFVYVPDAETETAYPVNWANWGKTEEMGFISSFFASNTTIAADLFDTEINTPDGAGGFAQWDVIYSLVVTDVGSGSSTRYRGRAVLEFTLEGSFWYLSYWRDEQGEQDLPDNPNSTLQTMGALRGTFAGS